MITGRLLALGRTHAHTIVTVHIAKHTITVDLDDGEQRTFRQTIAKPIRSWKAHKLRRPSVC